MLRTGKMIYLKSVLAGLVALIASLLLCIAGFIAWNWWSAQGPSTGGGGGVVAYDINFIAAPLLVIIGAVFFLGFWWELRRASRVSR